MDTSDFFTISQDEQVIVAIPAEMQGSRLDKVLAELFPDFSRSRLQQWLKEGAITLNGKACAGKYKVLGHEHVVIKTSPVAGSVSPVLPQNIALNIVYQDADLIVLDKPSAMVVHTAAGNWDGTLQNALLHHFPELASLPRSGIVHRLDKDTSGLMVVARSLRAHTSLVQQLQSRSLSREYFAIVQGCIISGGTVNAPVGRHPVDRKRMAIREDGKEAITHYRVSQRFRAHTALNVYLETGRTHQIRVHMAHIQKPIAGDPVYGGRFRTPKGASEKLLYTLKTFPRQALHAVKLGLRHPASMEPQAWTSPLPEDMTTLLNVLTEEEST